METALFKKDDTVSPDKKEKVRKLREQAKSLLKGLQEDYFYVPPEVWHQDMQDALAVCCTLAELVNALHICWMRRNVSGI